MPHQIRFPEGTRFRLYPQAPGTGVGNALETVTVSPAAGTVGPGPSDDRMYTVQPIGKIDPYGLVEGPRGPELYLPPWDGPSVAPAMPGPDGHFDHLRPGDPGFEAAHLYGAVRFTLDVWEGYLGHPIDWHFTDHFDRLELSMVEDWANAHMGYGYLETGSRFEPDGSFVDYALNFDVIAHEIGHAILVSLTGAFEPGEVSGDFEAFHEFSADWVALIASLHFDSVVEELLENTSGNLDTYNRLTRFGEISSHKQIRLANNNLTMRDFAHGWEHEHDLAKPLIGAFFDIFVDLYHEFLVENGGVSPALERLADQAERDPSLKPRLQQGFEDAYQRRPESFDEALNRARDTLAEIIVVVWRSSDLSAFCFEQLALNLFGFLESGKYGKVHQVVENGLLFREIGLRPSGARVRNGKTDSHTRSARLIHPGLDRRFG